MKSKVLASTDVTDGDLKELLREWRRLMVNPLAHGSSKKYRIVRNRDPHLPTEGVEMRADGSVCCYNSPEVASCLKEIIEVTPRKKPLDLPAIDVMDWDYT